LIVQQLGLHLWLHTTADARRRVHDERADERRDRCCVCIGSSFASGGIRPAIRRARWDLAVVLPGL